MLTEYALTPHLFDDQHNANDPEWLEELRAFGERLLPISGSNVFNTFVSDLCDGSWFKTEVASIIASLEQRRLENRVIRLPALDLLKTLRPRLERHLVTRPYSETTWPEAEEDWAGEAHHSSSSSGIPIHRIVASSRLGKGPRWTILGDACGEKFWQPVQTPQRPRADVGEQIGLLRRMSAFYTFLAFASPHLKAKGAGKDLPFAVALAKDACRRPTGFDPLARIDLHSEGSIGRDSTRQEEATAILKKVKDELGPAIRMVRLFLWKTLKERSLLFGQSNGSDRKPRVIWAVSPTHVARPDTDNPNRDRHTFAVLPRAEVSKLAGEFYSNADADLYPGSPFRFTS